MYVYMYIDTHTHIYDPGSRFADPPPQWYPPPPTLPKPKLCDIAHFSHMRAPKATTVTRTPDPCDSAHFSGTTLP